MYTKGECWMRRDIYDPKLRYCALHGVDSGWPCKFAQSNIDGALTSSSISGKLVSSPNDRVTPPIKEQKQMALYTKAALAKQGHMELVALAFKHGLDTEDKPGKVEVIKRLLTLGDDDALLDAEEEELDEELDDEPEEEAPLEDELDDEELDEEDLEEELPEVDEVDEAPVKKTRTRKAADPDAPAKPARKVKAVDADGKETLAAKQVATILGTEAKTLRQFLRSDASTLEAVGSGGRYEFTEADVPTIKSEFEAWRAAHAARGSKRGPKGSTPSKAEAIVEVEDIEELELDDEIDDEELELEDEE